MKSEDKSNSLLNSTNEAFKISQNVATGDQCVSMYIQAPHKYN